MAVVSQAPSCPHRLCKRGSLLLELPVQVTNSIKLSARKSSTPSLIGGLYPYD